MVFLFHLIYWLVTDSDTYTNADIHSDPVEYAHSNNDHFAVCDEYAHPDDDLFDTCDEYTYSDNDFHGASNEFKDSDCIPNIHFYKNTYTNPDKNTCAYCDWNKFANSDLFSDFHDDANTYLGWIDHDGGIQHLEQR